ncbi:hypothetical protein AGLY_006241 [Aphis glycines]|uniref:Uncharacterized protein n=1 Tax=Aphis glycines TaxID=307491 RepID=A0A6G0TRR3_APHGL|nr:hypothetical protein AGLY_006241 [Aphis glycines]
MYSYNFLITIRITYEELCIKFSRPKKFYRHFKKKFSEKLKISVSFEDKSLSLLFLVIQNFFTDTSKKNSHKNRKFHINNPKKFLNYNHIKKSFRSKISFAKNIHFYIGNHPHSLKLEHYFDWLCCTQTQKKKKTYIIIMNEMMKVKSKKFPEVFKKFRENKKMTENWNFYQNQFSIKFYRIVIQKQITLKIRQIIILMSKDGYPIFPFIYISHNNMGIF